MVFHNLWKEKMGISARKSKKVRKYKRFFKQTVENYVESVDKSKDIFPQKSVENENKRNSPFWEIMDVYELEILV